MEKEKKKKKKKKKSEVSIVTTSTHRRTHDDCAACAMISLLSSISSATGHEFLHIRYPILVPFLSEKCQTFAVTDNKTKVDRTVVLITW
jgi:ADP-ribosylglycohydrolase